MKKLMITLLVLFGFSVPAYAQMGMMGSQQGQMGQGMKGERQMMDLSNAEDVWTRNDAVWPANDGAGYDGWHDGNGQRKNGTS